MFLFYNTKKRIVMEILQIHKSMLSEWCEKNLSTHTDWTGKRVETINECDSIEEFVDKLYTYLENNQYRI